MISKIERLSNEYPIAARIKISNFLEYLYGFELIELIYVAGAFTFDRIDEFSDMDIHCVVKDGKLNDFKKIISNYVEENRELIFYFIKDRKFPWFGELNTIYFKSDPIFYFDIGCIEKKDIGTFYFQYKGLIVKDNNQILLDNVKRSENDECSKVINLLNYQKDQIVSVCIKVNKDIARSLFWNAIENINQLRRAFVFIYSFENYYHAKFPFIGRVERDIEKVWSSKDLELLTNTNPNKTIESIKQAFSSLIYLLIKLETIKSDPILLKFLLDFAKTLKDDKKN